jgi:molybdopterin converting factor small subunit
MRQTISVTEESFVLKSPAYCRDLLSSVLEAHPLLSTMMPTMTVLVDGLLAQPSMSLNDGDEVDFLPAVVGG